MAQPYYLVTATPGKLAKIAKHARRMTGSRHGDPVLAIGSHRIALLPAAVQAVLDHAGADMALGREPQLEGVLSAMGAQGAIPIRADRLAELLTARDPLEFTRVGRLEAADSDLKIDGWDWHLKCTRLVEAWDLLGGPDGIDWRDIRVGQIDTGFRPHPCLGFDAAGRSRFVLTDFDRNYFPGDFSSLSESLTAIPVGFAPPASEESALDPLHGGSHDGHGTRTGSVLAGRDESQKAKYFGGAPRVPYIPVRICDSVIINHVQRPLAQAIVHLVNHGCSVITLSMGMALTVILRRLRKAIDFAYDHGVILVTAAGNIWDPVVAPARLNRTLAIAGCTPALAPWLGSSFGPEVDVSAPAWPIRRASVDRRGDPAYGYGDGTSFATPLVAATAALWLRHRDAEIEAAYPHAWQRVEAFKTLLRGTAQRPTDWNRRLYGEGILDARAVLDAVLPDATALKEDARA